MRDPIGEVRRERRPLVVLLVAGALACGDGGREGTGAVVRDSAGVTIVENAAETGAVPTWTLTDTPQLAIGVVEGAEEYLLEDVTAAASLSDGRIMIADAGPGLLRFYSSEGTFLSAKGGKGEGPGEFDQMARVFVAPGDSISVWDFGLRRLSVFSATGEFARMVRLQPPPDAPWSLHAVAMLGDGRILTRPGTIVRPGVMPRGIWRDSVDFPLFAPDGSYIDSYGPWPDTESFGHEAVPMIPRAFARSTSIATGGDRIYVGDNARWQVEVYADGALRRIIRLQHEPVPVTQEMVNAFRLRSTADGRLPAEHPYARMMADMPFPETLPAYAELVVDDTGHLWVRAYPSGDGPRHWTVFDEDGRRVASATTPQGFGVTHIGADRLVGVHRDDMGVERVHVYGLTRTAE